MATIFPVSGCKFYIGVATVAKSTPYVLADFTGATYVEVPGWTNMGGASDNAQEITLDVIGEGRTSTAKGTFRAQTQNHTFTPITADAGQAAMLAAAAAKDDYFFKIEYNDKPAAGASPKNGTDQFVGKVFMWGEQGGGANTARQKAATINVNSNFFYTAPSAT